MRSIRVSNFFRFNDVLMPKQIVKTIQLYKDSKEELWIIEIFTSFREEPFKKFYSTRSEADHYMDYLERWL